MRRRRSRVLVRRVRPRDGVRRRRPRTRHRSDPSGPSGAHRAAYSAVGAQAIQITPSSSAGARTSHVRIVVPALFASSSARLATGGYVLGENLRQALLHARLPQLGGEFERAPQPVPVVVQAPRGQAPGQVPRRFGRARVVERRVERSRTASDGVRRIAPGTLRGGVRRLMTPAVNGARGVIRVAPRRGGARAGLTPGPVRTPRGRGGHRAGRGRAGRRGGWGRAGRGRGGGGDGTRPRGGRSSAGGGVPGGFGLARLRDDARGALLEDGVHARGEGVPGDRGAAALVRLLERDVLGEHRVEALDAGGDAVLERREERLRVLLELVHRLWGGGGRGVGGEGGARRGVRGGGRGRGGSTAGGTRGGGARDPRASHFERAREKPPLGKPRRPPRTFTKPFARR